MSLPPPLFDIGADPYEELDLAGEHPGGRVVAMVRALKGGVKVNSERVAVH